MPYVTGTRSAIATPAQDIIENVLNALLTSAGFTYVKSSTAQSGHTFRFYRAQAGNWYVFLGHNSTATTIYFGVCEEFNETSNAISYPSPPPGGSSSYTVDASGRHNVTNVTSYTSYAASFSVQTDGLTYWASATTERLVFGFRTGTLEQSTYCGTLQSVPSVIASFPSIICASFTTVQNAAGLTREPGVSAGSGYRYCMARLSSLAMTTDAIDCYSNTYHLGPVVVLSSRTPNGYRGRLRDCIMMGSTSITTSSGDTMTVAGKVYVNMKYSSNVWVDTTV